MAISPRSVRYQEGDVVSLCVILFTIFWMHSRLLSFAKSIASCRDSAAQRSVCLWLFCGILQPYDHLVRAPRTVAVQIISGLIVN